MKKRLLTSLLSLVFILTLFPTAALAVDEVVAQVEGNNTYRTLQEAIEAAQSGETVMLLADVTESITVGDGQDIVLDLNGYTLTNTEDCHTITNNGTLTIQDTSTAGTGTVDNVSHQRAAIYNEGTMTIEGGTYTRSAEVQCTNGNDFTSTNSWYTVVNIGTLTITSGFFTTGAGTSGTLGNLSSLIRNGIDLENTGTLTITGGTFLSAANVIKNEPESVIVLISGGTFIMDNTEIGWYGGNNMLQSYGTILSITGGTFKALGSGVAIDETESESRDYFRHGIGVYVDGKIENIGGAVSFEMEDTQNCLIRSDGNGSITITGGTYTLREESDDNTFIKTSSGGSITISGGNFSESVEESFLDESIGAELIRGDSTSDAPYSYYPSVEEAQEIATADDIIRDLTVEKDEGATYYDVTVDYNDGNNAKVIKEVAKNDNFTLPTTPTRSGYTFTGWLSDVDNETYEAGARVEITGNTTFSAQWRRNSSSSGGGSTRYTITVEDADNGSVSASASRASYGTTVTITVSPDDGYELDDLIVTDASGNEISVTKASDTRYTFTMPRSAVTVEAAFVAVEDEVEDEDDTEDLIFADVTSGSYYYDAVYWAVENGVTTGTSTTTFSPDASCTRAQMVTFLWRAAGSPEPETSAMPFTDVSSSAYYYDAVLWAVENGITAGTSATTFSPDLTVTRAQTATFLYRYAGSPAVSGSNPFTDVSADAYYADAVQWAASEGITAGTSTTTFSPNNDCTRAQIVTFLYRYMG